MVMTRLGGVASRSHKKKTGILIYTRNVHFTIVNNH